MSEAANWLRWGVLGLSVGVNVTLTHAAWRDYQSDARTFRVPAGRVLACPLPPFPDPIQAGPEGTPGATKRLPFYALPTPYPEP